MDNLVIWYFGIWFLAVHYVLFPIFNNYYSFKLYFFLFIFFNIIYFFFFLKNFIFFFFFLKKKKKNFFFFFFHLSIFFKSVFCIVFFSGKNRFKKNLDSRHFFFIFIFQLLFSSAFSGITVFSFNF